MTPDPRSSAEHLPGVYRDLLADEGASPLLHAVLEAFDEALGPVFEILDNQHAYFDPTVAPPHALRWLTAWLGLVTDETRPIETRRRIVAEAGALYAAQGTLGGLRRQVAVALGADVQIEDESGGVSWTDTPDEPLPERPLPAIVVWVRPSGEAAPDAFLARASAVVRSLTPVGVRSRVELSS